VLFCYPTRVYIVLIFITMDYSLNVKHIKYTVTDDTNENYKIYRDDLYKFIKIFRYVMNKKNKTTIYKIQNKEKRKRAIKVYNELYNYVLNMKSFVINTNLKFNGKKLIGLPRPSQITPEFIKLILSILKHDAAAHDMSSNTDTAGVIMNNLPNDVITKIYKSIQNCELTNGSISSQNQGNKSLLKQSVMPGLYNNMFRAVIVPTDCTYGPTEIGIPRILVNTYMNDLSIGDRYAVVITRQPMLVYSAPMTVTVIRPIDGQYVRIHPSIIKHANADFDGDQLIMTIYHGCVAVTSIPLALSGMFSMNVGFGMTKMTFPQPVVVRMHKYDHIVENDTCFYGRMYKYVKSANGRKSNTMKHLTDTLRCISELYGSRKAYAFYEYIERVCYSTDDVFPIKNYAADDPVCNYIVRSGIQSSADMLTEKTTEWFPIKNHLDKIVKFCVEYLLSATNISNQYTSTIRIQQVLQNVYIDDDVNVMFRYDSTKEPMFISTAIDFLDPSLFMSEHTLNYILDM